MFDALSIVVDGGYCWLDDGENSPMMLHLWNVYLGAVL